MGNNKFLLVGVIILSLGIFGAGYTLGKSLYLSRMMNRTVTVKGIAERDVKSDLGIWEIDYREIGDNLAVLNTSLQRDLAIVVTFLKSKGFVDAELEAQPVRVEDRQANAYAQTNAAPVPGQRYVVTSGVRIRSTKVNLIQQVNQLTGTLLTQGVSVTFDTGGVSPNPSYYYTQLDAIRPSMLADATKSARLVAEQFAKDAGTNLNGIQHASQGVFQIMSRDTSTMSADWNSSQSALGSIDKKVRLVTTLDYRLK